jgi:hypothetical protein
MDGGMRPVAAVLLALALAGLGTAGLRALGSRQQERAVAAAWSARLAPPRPPTAAERLLAPPAERIAGRPVDVLCDGGDLPSAGPGTTTHGVVWFYGGRPADYAVIAPNLCRELLRVRRDGLGPREAECLRRWAGLGCGERIPWLALAAATLAHEAFHLRGVRDEAAADCYAIQAVELVAAELGLDEREAAGLGAFARANHRVGQARPYRSGECREGGGYDLTAGRDDGLG